MPNGRRSGRSSATVLFLDFSAHPRHHCANSSCAPGFNMVNLHLMPSAGSAAMDDCNANAIPQIRPGYGNLERKQPRILVRDQLRKPRRSGFSRTLRLFGELASAPQEPGRDQDWRLALSNAGRRRRGRGMGYHGARCSIMLRQALGAHAGGRRCCVRRSRHFALAGSWSNRSEVFSSRGAACSSFREITNAARTVRLVISSFWKM